MVEKETLRSLSARSVPGIEQTAMADTVKDGFADPLSRYRRSKNIQSTVLSALCFVSMRRQLAVEFNSDPPIRIQIRKQVFATPIRRARMFATGFVPHVRSCER